MTQGVFRGNIDNDLENQSRARNYHQKSIIYLTRKLEVNYRKEKTGDCKLVKVVSGAFGDALLKIIEKLTGKASNVEPNFKNLTLDVASVKTTLNGSVTLNIQYATEKKQ